MTYQQNALNLIFPLKFHFGSFQTFSFDNVFDQVVVFNTFRLFLNLPSAAFAGDALKIEINAT